jgi:flavin-dependent dehydrogenase
MLMEHAERSDEAMDLIAAGGGPAGLMTAALPDAAGVRAEACERGSEPTRQSRGTATHPRTLEVPTMPGAGDGRRISDVLPAQGRRVPDTHCAGMPRPARLPRPGHAVRVHADAPAAAHRARARRAPGRARGALWRRGDRGRAVRR